MVVGESALQREVHALYSDHHGWLCGWLRSRLGNSCDAADIAHDTFMRVWTGYRADAIPPLREPRAYLTTVARRLMVNHFERQSLERAYLASLALLPEALVPSVEERAILLETLHELDALLDELPPPVRTAFLMSQRLAGRQVHLHVRPRLPERHPGTGAPHARAAMARPGQRP